MAYAALAIALILFPAFATSAFVGPPDVGRRVLLPLPHELREGETVWLEVKVGVIERGADVEIRTEEGELVAALSPVRAGHPAGIYPVPLPATAISKNRVVVRLVLNDYQRPKRAPTSKEVSDVRVK